MKKWLHRIFIVLVLGVFVVSAVKLVTIWAGYQKSKNIQQEAVQEYTRVSSVSTQGSGAAAASADGGQQGQAPGELSSGKVYAPIEVDFARLKGANGDVVGWLYCEDSVINYPVVYGRDNEYYLERNYLGNYDPSGAIFTDMRNEDGFADHNVILYGHHMQDGSMFASLKKWMDQAYYEAHPVMWLLTPEQDYRVEIFAGYLTTADSDTYSVFREGGERLEGYLNWAKRWSAFTSDVETEPDGHYIVLSTCAYSSDDARTALHGKLVPIDSAGGIPLA